MRQITPSNRRIVVRVTEDEFEKILLASRTCHMKLSDFIRHGALSMTAGVSIGAFMKRNDRDKYEEFKSQLEELAGKEFIDEND